METPKKHTANRADVRKSVSAASANMSSAPGSVPNGNSAFQPSAARAGQPPAEVLRQLIDRGTVRARITREQLDFMAQLKGIARNLNQLTRLANAKGLAAVRVRHAAIVTAIEKLLKQIGDGR